MVGGVEQASGCDKWSKLYLLLNYAADVDGGIQLGELRQGVCLKEGAH